MRWPAFLSPQPLGPMPAWFKALLAAHAGALVVLWFDYLVNWRWVWRWVTGSVE